MKRPRRKRELLRPVHPNAGLRAIYKKRLDRLVDAMNASVCRWITAAYRANEPRMAMDATPAEELSRAVNRLARQWQRNFDEAAPELGEWFGRAAWRRSDEQLKAILKKGGFTVAFKLTPAMRDVLDATVQANVSLIKSIPEQYLTQVEGMVMRSVQTGRDLGQLTRDLEEQLGVTKRRAALIARDQNNKATSALQKARQTELGIEKGVWIHSGGGKEPRPKHVDADGKTFDLAKGMKVGDKGDWVMPGQEINCRCVWRPVIPGF